MYISDSWRKVLTPAAIKTADTLFKRAAEERSQGKIIYPPQNQILAALYQTPPDTVKVVILGQDPYHERNQANGLAFSVNKGVPIPPSLRNIYKELESDIGCPAPQSGDLMPWAQQGVLLLNTSLTVEQGKAGSHVKWGWNSFVYDVCRACMVLPQPVVFCLWGLYARNFVKTLPIKQHTTKLVLCSSHPSPLGARKKAKDYPAFLGSQPFSKANAFLIEHGSTPIDWGRISQV